jgi:outer membrane protein assembly factor BamD (BamD/ComL family)
MRNRYFQWIVPLILICAAAPGCSPRIAESDKAVLDAGYAALEARQYNQAIANADAFLARSPHGPGTPEALYLRGRGYEGKVAGNPASAGADLQSARTAYIQVLEMNPAQPLKAYAQTSLANVAYFQEDYQTALQQWAEAYDKLDRDDIKAWALYRMGVCQQRMGDFDRADRTFAQVQQRHAKTEPAQRARDHQGARAFYVQVGTFTSAASADRASADLRVMGITPLRLSDSQGHQFVRAGPFSKYAQAQQIKTRVAGRFPDAIIVP